METEFYPMPSFPTFAVRDLVASTRWYQEVLGFQLIFEMPGPNDSLTMTHLRWAKYADLLLVNDSGKGAEPKGIGFTLTFAMGDKPIEEFAEQILKNGVDQEIKVIDQPWNVREVSVVDPDGFRLIFTQPINIEMTMDELIENVKSSG